MNFSRTSLFLASVLAISTSGRAAVPPYLETAPVTILWNFDATYLTGTTIGSTPVPVPDGGAEAIMDPLKLRPVDRITTETGNVLSNTENGDQAFFIKQFLRARLEKFAEEAKTYADDLVVADDAVKLQQKEVDKKTAELNRATSTANFKNEDVAAADKKLTEAIAAGNADTIAAARAEKAAAQAAYDTARAERDAINEQLIALESRLTTLQATFDELYADDLLPILTLVAQIKILSDHLSLRWEITAVRAPQRTVQGLIDNPYHFYLSAIDPTVAGRPTQPVLIDFSLTPYASLAESITSTPKVTTYYTVSLSFYYSTSPLYPLALPILKATDVKAAILQFGRAVSGQDYNSSGTGWELEGSGYMSYTVRKTKSTDVGVVPTKVTVTGIASWGSIASVSYGGIAPMKMLIGEAKFQNGNLFPDFPSE